jgi:hypothetical protein
MGIVTNLFKKEEEVLEFIITLTDEQWSAYQGASDGISKADVVVWLKNQLNRDYNEKLEAADGATQRNSFETLHDARKLKMLSFKG